MLQVGFIGKVSKAFELVVKMEENLILKKILVHTKRAILNWQTCPVFLLFLPSVMAKKENCCVALKWNF